MKFDNLVTKLSAKPSKFLITNRHLLGIAAIASIAATPLAAEANIIVVSNDEWELTDTGFANAAGTGQFVKNLVSAFGPNIHAYSTNFGFTGSSLAASMTAAGATYTTSGLGSFNLPTLSTYNAIMLGGNYLSAAQMTTLNQYVAGGGNVYLAGGTGDGGAVAEAAAWNPFLNSHGLSFASSYNGISGNIAVSGNSIFNSVGALYQNNGNSITGSGVACCSGYGGLYAVVAVPEPEEYGMMLLGFGMVGWQIKRKQRKAAPVAA